MNKIFDLNIDKILENWDIHHAVREIIANSIDEQKITKTNNIEIFKDNEGKWHIRDYGRGLSIEHFTMNENEEKISNEGIIGKFGIGLKDALATFDRNKIKIKIISSNGIFTMSKNIKQGFEDIITLHIYYEDSYLNTIEGTDFIIENISDYSIEKAKRMFLLFSNELIIDENDYGQIIRKCSNTGIIYINGVKVSEEPNFLFSYNITNLNSALRKALNRERTNLGRTAYSERIKNILLSSNSWDIAKALIEDLNNYQHGIKHDELNWLDVQEHATKIYSKVEKVVYVTPKEIENSPDIINEIKSTGNNLVVIPENLNQKLKSISNENTKLISKSEIEDNPNIAKELESKGNKFIIVPDEVKEKSISKDVTTNTITSFNSFIEKRNDNFDFKIISYNELEQLEKTNYELIEYFQNLVKGKIPEIKEILISETMQRDNFTFSPSDGLYIKNEKKIILKRSVLSDRKRLIAVLLHEICHAKSNADDSTREFENELTNTIGILGDKVIEFALLLKDIYEENNKLKENNLHKRNSFWSRIFKKY